MDRAHESNEKQARLWNGLAGRAGSTCRSCWTSFDTIISRFGVMFFDDAVRAFANLRRAAANDARLRFIAWIEARS